LTFALLPLLACLCVLGCQPEEKITRHTRQRFNDMKRLLAAMVLPEKPEEQKTWVFKVVGAESAIDPLAETFDEFVKSIKIVGDTPTWTLPPGWTADKGEKDKRFATLHTGPKGSAPEVAVSSVEGEMAASVAANVNRWRGQLGWENRRFRLGPDDALDYCKAQIVDGRQVFVVDLTGPGSPALMGPGNVAPAKAANAPALPFSYEAPPGWKKMPPNPIAMLAFEAVGEGRKVEITVTALKGQGGGLLANVNRWRDQVKLDAWAPSELDGLPEVAIGAANKGKLIDVTGPKAPPERNRIIGAILFRANDSLFFKMMGPSDAVRRQRPAFEAFLKSVTFGG
jgi:hypothetical protein